MPRENISYEIISRPYRASQMSLNHQKACSVFGGILAHLADFQFIDGRGIVSEPGPDVGENGGDGVVVEVAVLRHQSVVRFAVHLDLSLQSVQNGVDQPCFISCYPFGSCERWKAVVVTLAVPLETSGTVVIVKYTSLEPVALMQVVVNLVGCFDVRTGFPLFH